jgi:hypothetical protein
MATREELVAVAHAHAQAEAEGDLATTMATLEDDPLYEFQPAGKILRGTPVIERYYQHFFDNDAMEIESYELRNEWITDDGLGQEYVIHAKLPDGSRKRYDIIGILTFGESKLSGERLYASEEFLHLLVGPVYAEAEPMEG